MTQFALLNFRIDVLSYFKVALWRRRQRYHLIRQSFSFSAAYTVTIAQLKFFIANLIFVDSSLPGMLLGSWIWCVRRKFQDRYSYFVHFYIFHNYTEIHILISASFAIFAETRKPMRNTKPNSLYLLLYISSFLVTIEQNIAEKCLPWNLHGRRSRPNGCRSTDSNYTGGICQLA